MNQNIICMQMQYFVSIVSHGGESFTSSNEILNRGNAEIRMRGINGCSRKLTEHASVGCKNMHEQHKRKPIILFRTYGYATDD